MSNTILLNNRPEGKPQESDFKFVEQEVGTPGEQELLVEALYVSVIGLRVGTMNEVLTTAFGEVTTESTSVVGVRWKSAQLHCRQKMSGTKPPIFPVNQHLEIGLIKLLVVGQLATGISMGNLSQKNQKMP